MECVDCSQPLTSQGGESEGGTCTDETSAYHSTIQGNGSARGNYQTVSKHICTSVMCM